MDLLTSQTELIERGISPHDVKETVEQKHQGDPISKPCLPCIMCYV